jgi:sugar lactone lactonase YvrE
MNIRALNAPASELGEGIFIDKVSKRLYWVDINNSNLFQYSLDEDKLLNTFDLKEYPSCIFSATKSSLIYSDSHGVKSLCLESGESLTQSCHPHHDPEKHRANDGVFLNDGSKLYGTMSYVPSEHAGKIYRQDLSGKIEAFDLGIHIPNTFIQVENKVFISDSLKQCTYELNLATLEEKSQTLWRDFSEHRYTPDGGCVSDRGYLHIALWDGASIGVFDITGALMRYIDLPVLRPTNCQILDNRWLYVTSASENMTEEQKIKYPQSGKTLVLDLGNNYEY